ncbi:MAG: hypothetical protein CFE21_08820 [Bacteroidetes bacterium B1(2017)]|nr:MAG: hypothetical protein CFE21_08820 [Bacteroidetes bacterium B1(2017)]
MNKRILGFDLARAYAIFGMFIVNFVFCFGSFRDPSILGKFINLFIGNSTSIFIVCAGLGVVLLAKQYTQTQEDINKVKSILFKRSLFLFFLGLLLYNWWPGDILHFYGGYMHIALLILFVPKRYYIWIAILFLLVYIALQQYIPIFTSWDLQTTKYADFWTPIGFLRNTFYNGWNSIFPWFAFFSMGMYLGHLDWHNKQTSKKVFVIGLGLLLVFKALRLYIMYDFENPLHHQFYIDTWFYIMEDYFPVNIPFFMITLGWAFIVISTCMLLADKYSSSKLILVLANTGKMTLSLYVFHMTIGVLILSLLSSKKYTGFPPTETPISSAYLLGYATLFFVLSVIFSNIWSKYFSNGPLETIMRKVSN